MGVGQRDLLIMKSVSVDNLVVWAERHHHIRALCGVRPFVFVFSLHCTTCTLRCGATRLSSSINRSIDRSIDQSINK